MKLAGRIQVEPLDEERLTNIERRVVAGAAEAAARPHREARVSPALAFAAAAVAVVGAGALGWRLGAGGASPAPAAESAPLRVSSDASRTTLDIGDARIQSDLATAFDVTRPGGGVLVALTRGKVELEVQKRGDRAPLVVRAGDTDVIVVGTRFSVDYGDGTGAAIVRVTEGVVRVVRHQQETRVAAGQAWAPARGLVALAELGPLAAREGEGATISDPARRGGDAVDIDMSDAPGVLRDRVAAVPDVRAPQPGAAQHTGGPHAPGSAGASEPIGRPRPLDNPRDPKFELKSQIRSQPVQPALEVGEPDALRAMALYRQIMTREKGPTEAHAFYSMAVIQALKLGRTGDALTTLAAFARRAPTSEHYVPALWLEVRIRCLRDIDDECRQAADRYLRRAPEGPARTVAEKITLTK